MTTLQGDRQASFRAIGGTAGTLNEDMMAAMAVELADEPDTLGGRWIDWLQLRLGSAGTNLNGLLAEWREAVGDGVFDPAFEPITHLGGAEKDGTAADAATHTLSFTLAAGVSRKLVVIAVCENATAATFSGTTFDGTAMTGLTQSSNGGNECRMFYYDVPDAKAPGAYDIVVSVTPNEGVAFWAYHFDNMAAGAPTDSDTIPSTRDTTTDGSLTLTGLEAGSVVVSAVTTNGNSGNVWTPTTGAAEVIDKGYGGSGGCEFAAAYHLDQSGTYATGWTRSSAASRVAGVAAAWPPA